MGNCFARDASLTRRDRLGSCLQCGVIVGSMGFLFFFDPESSSLYAPCPFRWLSGLHCPGCGTLRGLYQILHGDLAGGVGLNPLMAMSLPFLGYAFLSKLMHAVSGRSLPRVFIPARWIWFLVATIVSFWILRNIPAQPFSLLAP